MNTPVAPGGVFSTAQDAAVFGQMFLNGGIYNGNRILSRASVATMTGNQIPGVSTNYRGEYHAAALWGYGWNIFGGDNWKYYMGTLLSPDTFSHDGAGGVFLWVDPIQELVGVYFSVALRATGGLAITASELFANAITAAIDD